MSKKSILLALSVACAAMFVVPAVASAGQWTMEPPRNFTTHSGHTVLTTNVESDPEVTCTSSTGSGTTNADGKGGTIHLTFHNCEAGGTHCTTTGQSTATITTTTVTWKAVYLKHDKSTPGIKITGHNNGHIATFRCGFGLVTIKVEGSVLGDIEEPCNTTSNVFTVNFKSTAPGIQEWTKETLTGLSTDLKVFRNGVERTGAQDGTGKITLTGGPSKIHCA